MPQLIFHKLDTEADQFVLMASDGLWDVLTESQAAERVLAGLKKGTQLKKTLESLIGKCVYVLAWCVCFVIMASDKPLSVC